MGIYLSCSYDDSAIHVKYIGGYTKTLVYRDYDDIFKSRIHFQ